MGGMSIVGTGAGTTKIYEGSGISSFNISMKWYTPVDKTYKEALTALMILGFPSHRNAVKKSEGLPIWVQVEAESCRLGFGEFE
jgi:hypothetical protein